MKDKEKKPKVKREFNPKAKAYIRQKKEKAGQWMLDHKEGIDAITSILELAAAAGSVGGLAHKAKDVISKDE